MTITELDGFLAGLVVAPELIEPEEWLPEVWGRDEDEGALFSDREDLDSFIRLVIGHYNAISQDLNRGPGRYSPIYDVDQRHDDVLWEIWISGFQRAMALRPESWLDILESDDQAAADALRCLTALIAIERRDEALNLKDADIEELQQAAPDLIPLMVETLNTLRLRNDQVFLNTPAKIKAGRNDPCPCGSGKKFKKCCGLL